MNEMAQQKIEALLSKTARTSRFDISQVCPNGFSEDIITL